MQVEITNTGEWAALLVWLEDARPVTATGFAYFDANYFCLLPGESRSVHVEWEDVPPEEQYLTIKAWNTGAFDLHV
jgi:beta-mannosidase